MSEAISKNKEAVYKEALQKAKNKIEQLQAENAQLNFGNKKCEIAVTGYSCRFPSGANSPEEYWKRLADGFDAVSEIKRFDVDSVYDPQPGVLGKMATRSASFLDVNIKEFDNIHFNISAVEAKSLDPQYRLLMEVCWEALLDAGEDPERLKNSKTGVFIGIDSYDYSLNEFNKDEYNEVGSYTIMGVSQHAAAGRISYYYDWKGPAMVCNTACSSSLSALNCAVSSLKNGQCDMVVVGGVNLLLSPVGFIGLSQFNAISPDGRCKTFDVSADGFGRGEGCGVIVLKRLNDAEKQGRNIRAVVKGIYAGQDGKSNGFYAPNGKAEQRVIENAIENAMVSVDNIDYVETHGTGTVLGDIIESQALCGAFKKKKNKLKIGSVKSNMGHLEAASGMASIIKVLLSMKHHMLPPSINIKQLNPEINWNKLEVVRSLTEWKKEDGSPLVAGISSFGISGALVHTIFESYDKNENTEKLPQIPCSLLTVSAKNEKELRASVEAAKDFIEENPEKFSDIIYSMQKCRSTLPIKYAVCGKDSASLCAEIQSSLDSEEVYSLYSKEPAAKKHKIAFLFTGQGAIYKDIAIGLYNGSPVYRKYFDLCCELFSKTLSVSIHDAVFGDNEDWVKRAIYSQAVTFSVEYSLYQYWKSLGIEPDIMLGHSIGEYAAACASGVMTLEDVVQMISWRGQMMDSVEPIGKMMGILSDCSSVEAAIAESGTQNVGVAACNADNNVTLAGIADSVDDVVNCLQKKKRVFVNDLNIPYPFHTKLMSHYEADYSAKVEKISLSKPDKTIVSTITADNDGTVFADSHYWAGHLSKTVRFAEAIRKVKELGADIYIEIGGTATLTGLTGQCLEISDDMLFLPSLRKGKSAYAQISETIQQLYLNGIEIFYDALYAGFKHSYIELYPYQFQRKEFWLENKQDSDKVLSKTIVESEKVVMSKEQKQENKVNRVKEKILNDIKMITGNDVEDIRTDQELFSLGLDSIMLLTLGKKIESSFNLEIPMEIFFTELNTIDALAEYLAKNQADMPEEVPAETTPLQSPAKVKTMVNASGIPASVPVYNVPAVNAPIANGDDISSLFNRQLSIMQEQLSVMKMLGGQMPVGQIVQAAPAVQDKAEVSKKTVKKMDTSFYKPYHKQNYKAADTSLTGSRAEYVDNIIEKYTKKMPTSKEYLSKYIFINANERHNSGFKREFKEMFYQVLAKDAHGSHIVDFDGNDFIDLTMGFGVNFFGYAPEFVTEAVGEELKHGFAISAHNKKTGEVAALISELTGKERVNFCNSGTEADMFAIRIARATTGKKKIVFFGGAYHGTADGLLGLPVYNEDGSISTTSVIPGITDGSVSDLIILGYNSQVSLDYITEYSDEIAGIIVETVQSRRPDLQPKEFLHKLRKITQEKNIALIFDEVITGFRICAGGAEECFGVKADMVTYGKVVGGGMPIGVIAGSARFMNSVDGGAWKFGDDSVPEYENQRTIVMGTFCHHPLTMAAAYATLSHIKAEKDTIYPEVNKKAEYFINTLNKYFEEENVPFHMVNFGTLFRFVIPKKYEIFFYSMITKGIFVWAGRNCFLCTEHTNEEIERIISAVKETICEMKEAGFFPESFTLKAGTGVEDKKVSADGVITKPASLIQQRLYIELKVNEEDPFDIVSAYLSRKKIDEERLEKVVNEIVQRHEVLRASFLEEDGQLVMKIQPSCKITINKMESSEDHVKLIQKSIKQFDLSKAPLFEVILVKHGEENILIFHFHHIVADGMSMDIFNREFTSLYHNENLPELKKQYSGYVDYEKQKMTEEWLKDRREFWINELQDCVTRLPLPYDKYPEKGTMAGSTYVDYIQKDELAYLKATAKKQGVSLFMILLSVIDVVLHKISGENNFVVSTPVTTKFAGGFEDNIGMFTNTMALGCHIEPSESFVKLLRDIKKMSLTAYSKSDYPYNMLVNDIDARGERAINVAFVYENTDGRDPNHINGLELDNIPFIKPVQENELLFECLEKSGVIEIQLGYQTDLFDEKTVRRICGYIHKTIASIIENAEQKIEDIEVIIEEDKELWKLYNTTNEEIPEESLEKLVHEQCLRTPDKIAVVNGSEKLTYAELWAKAKRVAGYLHSKGYKRNDYIAISGERSIWTIVNIIGILTAGCAYVPENPEYPKERNSYIRENSKCKDRLTVSSYTDMDISKYEPYCCVSDPDAIAYTIYTSGSTGTPKGVVIKHSAVANTIQDINNKFNVNEDSCIIGLSAFSFDLSVYDIFGSLSTGAKLVIVDDQRNIEEIQKIINKHKITFWNSVPAIMSMYLMNGGKGQKHLKSVLLSGDWIPVTLPDEIKTKFKNAEVCSLGGATEASIWSIFYPIKNVFNGMNSIPYGMPLANQKILILNASGKLCPIGAIGEICIAGKGVAEGYANQPEKTAAVFVDNNEYGRIYRTGDFGRMHSAGYIEFLGRIDEQVKIRGFRIELGEIESRIREIEGIKECAVIVRTDNRGDKAIYAYYTSDREESVSEIRDRLSESLPGYMVPSYMKQIETIPVTKNGKLDKKALPEIEGRITKEYIAPRNEAEEAVCEAFREILGVEKAGIQDSFFELGGDSIKAVRIISKLRNAGYAVTVKDVMNGKTAERIAIYIKNANEKPKYEQREVTGKIELTPVIRKFVEWQFAKPEHFNQSMMFPVEGIGNAVLNQAIKELVKHHDVLRAVYRKKELEILSISESRLCDFYEFDYRNKVDKYKAVEDKCTEIQGSIDLENGPLVKIAVFELGDTKQMLFCIHHLVVDGVSWRILQEDFETAVRQIEAGEEVKLPEKTASFIEWSQKLKEYGEKLGSKEKDYWEVANAKIAEGRIDGDYIEDEEGYAVAGFSKETTEKLLTKSSNAYGAKIDEVLLAGLARAVGRITGQKRVAVKLEGHGREEINEPISVDRTVGWFTNIYAVSLECSEDNAEAVINVKDTVRSVPNMGMGYGYVEHECEPDICFNYLGDFSGSKTSFVSEYSTGNDVSSENGLDSKILIDGQVIEEKLELFILTQYGQNFAEKIKNELGKSIEELAEYCSKDGNDKKTISDMEFDSIDVDGLSFINSLIG